MRWPWSKKSSTSYRNITTAEQLAEALELGAPSKAGIPVSMSRAVGTVAVLACAKVIARGLAQVPLRLLAPLPGGGHDAVSAGLGRLLYRQPNKFQSAYRFRNMMGLHLALTGSFAAYVNRVGGEVMELLPLPPDRLQVSGSMWEPEYSIDFGKGFRPIDKSEVLYIQGDTLDGVTTMPVTQYAREAIGLTMATDEHASKFFRNGGAASGHYTTDANPSTDERKAMLAAIKEMEEKQDSAFRRAALWNGLKYEHTSYANEQAQLKEIREQQIEEVARAFGVNPIMIGYTGGKTPTYASAEQLFIAHVVYCLGPWYEMVEQELDRQLLTDAEKDQGYEYKHMVQGLMRGSHKDRSEYFWKKWQMGSMNADEVRAYDDENPTEDGSGKTYYRPANTMPAGQVEGETE